MKFTVNFFQPHIIIFKKVENHYVPELENTPFFSLLLRGRGICEQV